MLNSSPVTDNHHLPSAGGLKSLLACALLLLATNTLAASFDCDKAQSTVEKMICAEPELSRLDEQLSDAYHETRKTSDAPEVLKAEQRQWLAERNRCGDAACIKSAYKTRLAHLQQVNGNAAEQATATPSEYLEPWQASCPAPNIDWRNYEWTIIVGNGWTACEEMLGYLRSQPKDQPPAVCPGERLPPNGNWTRPDWKEPPEPLRSELLKDLAAHGQKSQAPRTVRIAHIDITRDGEKEMLLLYGDTAEHSEKVCRDSSRCARVEGERIGYIGLRGGHYYNKLYAMNDKGAAIDWGRSALLEYGELVYYKGNPYWLTNPYWSQKSHDNFDKFKFGARPNDPYAAIFRLSPLAFGSQGLHRKLMDPVEFSMATRVTALESATCYFGYFHRDNLKQNPPKRR